jgi:hypothetical protein
VALSIYAVFSAQEVLYVTQQRRLCRPGVIVKIFEESTRDLEVSAARGSAVSLIAQICLQLLDSCLIFRLLHVTLLVQKGRRIHTPNNRKYVAWKSSRASRTTSFLRITGCF